MGKGILETEKLKGQPALAGNRTRVNCLEGSYANHYTTNATAGKIYSRHP